jgi:two-component system, chemotaxis family, protein-glutamate methylesterase/glutaminase
MSMLRSAWRNIDAAVIGASAGGVEALSLLLPRLPAACSASLFVVIHIPRERPSLLPELFAERCAVCVKEAEDKEPVRAGTVYFAPPDYHLLIDRELWTGESPGDPVAAPDRQAGRGLTVALSGDDPVHFSRPSIDVLFESAADAYGERLLGLILTGANEDGAAGLAAVRRARGRTVVQDPCSAAMPTLPEAALRGGSPDLLLSLEQLQELFAICPAQR